MPQSTAEHIDFEEGVLGAGIVATQDMQGRHTTTYPVVKQHVADFAFYLLGDAGNPARVGLWQRCVYAQGRQCAYHACDSAAAMGWCAVYACGGGELGQATRVHAPDCGCSRGGQRACIGDAPVHKRCVLFGADAVWRADGACCEQGNDTCGRLMFDQCDDSVLADSVCYQLCVLCFTKRVL